MYLKIGLHVVVFLLNLTDSASKAYWIVSNKPVMYGDNIILTCKAGHVLTDRRDGCRVRQWYSGEKRLLYNGGSVDARKYEEQTNERTNERTNVSSMEFSLVIKNYSESDLNIDYACSCDFESYGKRLGLNNNNFIVPPLRVDTQIQQSNEKLSIHLHIERVYPRSECYVAIGERTVFDNLTLTYVKRGIFYNATYDESINILADDCGKKPTLLCYIGNQYNIVNTSGEPIRNCTEERHDGVNRPGYINTSTESNTTVTSLVNGLLGVCLIVVGLPFLLIAWAIYYRKCRPIQNGKNIINSDGGYNNGMWTKESKIQKKNNSSVELNDEKCSLEPHANVSIELSTHILLNARNSM